MFYKLVNKLTLLADSISATNTKLRKLFDIQALYANKLVVATHKKRQPYRATATDPNGSHLQPFVTR